MTQAASGDHETQRQTPGRSPLLSQTPGRSPLRRTPAVLAWLRLARVYQKVDRASAEHLRSFGLSMAQFDVLARVGAAEGLSQQQLADHLLVTKGNITQLLNRMEQDGLVRRCQVGRLNRLYLTEQGRDLASRVVPAQEKIIASLLSSLPVEQQRHLLAVLRTLDHALD